MVRFSWSGWLQTLLVVTNGRRNALWSMGAGRAEISSAWFTGKTLSTGW